ncbi:PspC domain-containing protein [Blastococcus saxobsidens]|uniref:Two-component stress-responsive transcriptional regulator n=1 Tax=Blastococcus saxobsidens (strain DD2) TaxID=1146883 RepID=H6RLX6_BLASD|nr:PspC domain-containing protein [Blastococcus saxobsidens]CCG05055.1 Two-component stress-responsive transcriptional regulator [Blastococcus saxobsidens DD2]
MTSAPPPAPPTVEPPGWQPPPVRPQLRRSRSDKVIGGVNGGLADYTGIDALLWRVGFVALAVAGGTGVLVYLLLWLLMPAGADGPAPAAAPGQPAGAVRRREPAGPRSPVPGITVAGLLIVVGVLVLISRLIGWDIDAVGYLGTALAVVGAGLVAAAFSGGRTARGGLIALGVVLSLALAIAAAAPSTDGGLGDRSFRPQTVADVREVYAGGVGDLTVDLSDVPMADLADALDIEVQHGIGDVEVILPRSADARVRVDQGVGETHVLGSDEFGTDFFPGRGTAEWTDDGEAEIVLEINTGIGEVEVSRG